MFFKLGIAIALSGPMQAAAMEAEWLLPNFSSRLSVQVRNNADVQLRGLATLRVAKAQAVAPNFPGRLALAVLVDRGNPAQPETIIASQSDDLDGDGSPDEFEFPVELAARSQCRVDIYYSETLEDRFSWPKRVGAKHSYGYNREVVALESELAGYRMYGGFFLDFHGRKAGANGLWNDAAAYVPVRRDLGTGRDVLHIGNTLGLGGIFLRRDENVYQPPMNVPTYAHKSSPGIVPRYRVVSEGPLRAIVEATLDDWAIGDDVFRLRGRYAVDAGENVVSCLVEVVPLRIASSHEYELGIGVRDLASGSVAASRGEIDVTGQQNARDGKIGLAIYFDPGMYSPASLVHTADGLNHAAIANQRVSPGQATSISYAAAGAWSGSGMENVAESLGNFRKQIAHVAEIAGLTFARTPHPEKVGAEPQ